MMPEKELMTSFINYVMLCYGEKRPMVDYYNINDTWPHGLQYISYNENKGDIILPHLLTLSGPVLEQF
jgi:hypothetical protein